jgi:hypothetical protein
VKWKEKKKTRCEGSTEINWKENREKIKKTKNYKKITEEMKNCR